MSKKRPTKRDVAGAGEYDPMKEPRYTEIAAIAPAIDPDYRIDRERQFDFARPWGLTWLTHYC
jgi:hypothetical protein